MDNTSKTVKNLILILGTLAADCQKQIQPYVCILGPTRGKTAFNYKIPNPTRRQVVAWADLRTNGLRKDTPKDPA
jgi:hypothetical protein